MSGRTEIAFNNSNVKRPGAGGNEKICISSFTNDHAQLTQKIQQTSTLAVHLHKARYKFSGMTRGERCIYEDFQFDFVS